VATRDERSFNAAAKRAANRRTRIVRETRLAIVDLLTQAEREILATLATQPPEAETWRLQALQREVRRAMAQFADAAAAPAASGIGGTWATGVAAIDEPLAAAARAAPAAAQAGGAGPGPGAAAGSPAASVRGLPAIDTRALDAMSEFLTEKIRGISVAAADKINTELGLTIVGARSPFEAAQAVQKILGETTRERANVIVRTELHRAYHVAAQKRLEQAAARIPGMRKRWRRSGKVHSRWNHDLADGQTVAWDKPFVLNDGRKEKKGEQVELMYPGDPKAPPSETINCGCVLLPVLPEEFGLKPTRPAKKPFTDEELRLNPRKSDLADAVPVRPAPKAPKPPPPPPPPPQFPVPAFREAKTVKEAEALGQSIIAARGPVEYVTSPTGGVAKRFRHSNTPLPQAQQIERYFGKVSYTGLNVETANELNRWLIEAAHEADRLGLPRLRGVMTSPPRGARASMGDGILAVSKKLTVAEVNGPALRENRRINAARYDQWRAAVEPGGNGRTRYDRPFSAGGYYATELESARSTFWHEFGHHVHQQLGVTTPTQYERPPLEDALIKIFKADTVFPTQYAATSRRELFAESFSLLRMGKPEKLDRRILDFLGQVERGVVDPTVGGA